MTDVETIAFLVSNPDLPWLLPMAQRYPMYRDRFAELEQAYSRLHYTFRTRVYPVDRVSYAAVLVMRLCDSLRATRVLKDALEDRAQLLQLWRIAHAAIDGRAKLHTNWNEHWRRQ